MSEKQTGGILDEFDFGTFNSARVLVFPSDHDLGLRTECVNAKVAPSSRRFLRMDLDADPSLAPLGVWMARRFLFPGMLRKFRRGTGRRINEVKMDGANPV